MINEILIKTEVERIDFIKMNTEENHERETISTENSIRMTKDTDQINKYHKWNAERRTILIFLASISPLKY